MLVYIYIGYCYCWVDLDLLVIWMTKIFILAHVTFDTCSV